MRILVKCHYLQKLSKCEKTTKTYRLVKLTRGLRLLYFFCDNEKRNRNLMSRKPVFIKQSITQCKCNLVISLFWLHGVMTKVQIMLRPKTFRKLNFQKGIISSYKVNILCLSKDILNSSIPCHEGNTFSLSKSEDNSKNSKTIKKRLQSSNSFTCDIIKFKIEAITS